jgi:hypothetical protein
MKAIFIIYIFLVSVLLLAASIIARRLASLKW